MTDHELEARILQLVRDPQYQPLKPRLLARRLGLSADQQPQLKKAIKRLIKSGQVRFGPKHLVQLAPSRRNEVVGTFQRKSGGFGFVRPRLTSASGSKAVDIFVPAKYARDAATGDLVRVRVQAGCFARDGRPRGEIREVLERSTHQFVGTYFEQGGLALVQVDAAVFGEPVEVGDPGARNARVDDKVVIEMVRFPTHYRRGEGVIVDVLGPRGKPGVDTQMVIREFGLPGDFPEDVLDEARQQAEQFDENLPGDRRDLGEVTVITIDPVDARDFDDAISLHQRGEDGHWLLGVHIADVAHFVRAGTALDREARERGNSVYLPDRVLPMLPEVISNNLASLQPQRVRFTKSVFIEFAPDGMPIGSDICAAAIRSDRRFSYEEVDDLLASPAIWRERLGAEVFGLVDRMHRLAMILRRRRLERGALELSLPEIRIELDARGRVIGATRVEHTTSHQIIEEFMLAANEAVARHLADRGHLFLRRVHAAPDPRKLKSLTDFVRELGITAESLESRFEIKRVLAAVAGQPEEYAVNYAILRSLPKASYGPQEEGHYALSSDCYCHFTSPIRRYPDLTVHRLLDEILGDRKPVGDFDRLVNLGDHCSEREQRAEQAERELQKLKLLLYLSDRIGDSMRVVVTGVESYGLFAMGVELPAEGFLHVTALQDDYYHYDRTGHTLMGSRGQNQFRLGDLLLVEIAHVDLDRRELDFRLVRKLPHAGEGGPGADRLPKKQRAGKRAERRSGGPPGKGGAKKRRRR
jgi:ribonuclease R